MKFVYVSRELLEKNHVQGLVQECMFTSKIYLRLEVIIENFCLLSWLKPLPSTFRDVNLGTHCKFNFYHSGSSKCGIGV